MRAWKTKRPVRTTGRRCGRCLRKAFRLLVHACVAPTRRAVVMVQVAVAQSRHGVNLTGTRRPGQQRRRPCNGRRPSGLASLYLRRATLVNKITMRLGAPFGASLTFTDLDARENAVPRYCAPGERGGPRRMWRRGKRR